MGDALKKRLWFVAKLAVSAGIMYWIFHGIIQRTGADDLFGHLERLKISWVFGSALALTAAITCGILRWRRLLAGQGLSAPFGYLISTFMIGRFFGAVTPGGLGLAAFRAYDVAQRTGKAARTLAVLGVEIVLGWVAVGLVALLCCVLSGSRYVGTSGVVVLAILFGGIAVAAFSILWRPKLVRVVARHFPPKLAGKVHSMVDAVCAYEGNGALLRESALYGMGIHACNALIYVCAAKGLGVELPLSELFFVSVLQNVTAHVPVSVNGVGLREGAAMGLYGLVGIPPEVAVLIPLVGFTVEMIISSMGGLVLLARRSDYQVDIKVEHPEREAAEQEAYVPVPEREWPRTARGAAIGLGAGLVSGVLIGLAEAGAIVQVSHGRAEPDVWFFGALSYAVLCGAGGLAIGGLAAWAGRLMERRAQPEALAFARIGGAMTALLGLIIGLFRVQRDLFHEELVWKSPTGLGVFFGGVLAAVVLYFVLFFGLGLLVGKRPLNVLLQPLGSVTVCGLAIALSLALPGLWGKQRAQATHGQLAAAKTASASSGNVLFIVVDTLRADHLPVYGYAAGKTPNLDVFARDAVRFEQAFSNASWTRPSFASLLTGRYASSHGVMSKEASLPDAAETIAESFRKAGYATAGIVTNFNVAPFFNFQQGFDEYMYLTPDFLFGASDTAAKLSLIQIVRKVDETVRGKLNRVKPGSIYHDAETVNRELGAWLDRAPHKPWFLFVGYMDPHDPYFKHPYTGFGYARAAHGKPKPDEANLLRELYDGEISFWDDNFGKLVADLKQRGVYDDLTIVVTADHGEEFMDHGGFWHGTTLYDEQIHVPLFVKLPKNEKAGSVLTHWVESVDIMPTLLAQQKLPVPEAVQGVDLFRGKEQTFAEESHEGNVLKALRMRESGSQLKLIVANPNNPRGLGEKELYRVDVDKLEQNDLAGKDAPALARGEQTLSDTQKQVKVGALKAREVDLSMDKAAQDRLRELGYARE